MGIVVNIDNAIEEYKKSGKKTAFENSLRQVLEFAKDDVNLKSVSDLAYLLATAKAESDYSLQRWESDYQCGKAGVPYKDAPCQKALDYYRSSDGKRNYYNMGTDTKGLPYFGRGLIQLTGEGNYDKYGKLIGVDLLNNGDKALIPKNSYKIASIFLSNKRGGIYKKNGEKQNTFDLARLGDLTLARKSVNGGTKGLDEINKYYELWKKIIENNLDSKKKIKIVLGIGIVVLLVAGTITFIYLKKKGKLPNFKLPSFFKKVFS